MIVYGRRGAGTIKSKSWLQGIDRVFYGIPVSPQGSRYKDAQAGESTVDLQPFHRPDHPYLWTYAAAVSYGIGPFV